MKRSRLCGLAMATVVSSVISLSAAPARGAEGEFDAFMEVIYGIQTGNRFEFVDQGDIQGNYDFSIVPELSQLPGSLRVIGEGDPFFEYALFLNNVATVTGTVIYEFTIDIVPVPVPPGSPDLRMRSTLEYSVEDTDGDGSATLVPAPFSGLQQAVLSDDRTNVVSAPSLFLGFDTLDAAGDAAPSDTGLLPLLNVPPLPPGETIENYGVLGIRGSFDLSPGDTAVVTGRFEIVPEPAGDLSGDYNEDGVVNAADYVVWRNSNGLSVSLPNENPNAATPGVVDQEDYAFWVENFGNTNGNGSFQAESLNVPEPSTILTLQVFSSILAGFREKITRRRNPNH